MIKSYKLYELAASEIGIGHAYNIRKNCKIETVAPRQHHSHHKIIPISKIPLD